MNDTARETRRGVAYGLAAYLIWGFFPVYFRLVAHVAPLEVLAHRIAWSVVTLAVLLVGSRGWGKVAAALTTRTTLLTLCATALLISANWYVFVLSVDHGQVLQASLGYFINPLISVLLGVLFLRERLRPLQTISVLLALAGVLVLTYHLGQPPWISLVLGITFGLYGLLRKILPVDSLTGLSVETIILFPAASGYLLYLHMTGTGAFPSSGVADDILLPMSGVITVIPLLFFSASARRVRLATVGFMQYLTPTIHFLLAVLAFGEAFSGAHLASFVCIWLGLALYSVDTAHGIFTGRNGEPRP